MAETDTIDKRVEKYANKNNLIILGNSVLLELPPACDKKEAVKIFNGLRNFPQFSKFPEFKSLEELNYIVEGNQPYIDTEKIDGHSYMVLNI